MVVNLIENLILGSFILFGLNIILKKLCNDIEMLKNTQAKFYSWARTYKMMPIQVNQSQMAITRS